MGEPHWAVLSRGCVCSVDMRMKTSSGRIDLEPHLAELVFIWRDRSLVGSLLGFVLC